MRFFDRSFRDAKLGCAFAADFRYGDICQQINWYVRAHREKRGPVDFAFADWEIDGPLERNDAWEHSKRRRRRVYNQQG